MTDEGTDLGVESRFGLDVMRHGGDIRLLGPDSYGHAGAGGSLGFADSAAGIAFGYVMNRMGSSLLVDERAARLVVALRESIG